MAEPRWGSNPAQTIVQGSSLRSQPWAMGRNSFGVKAKWRCSALGARAFHLPLQGLGLFLSAVRWCKESDRDQNQRQRHSHFLAAVVAAQEGSLGFWKHFVVRLIPSPAPSVVCLQSAYRERGRSTPPVPGSGETDVEHLSSLIHAHREQLEANPSMQSKPFLSPSESVKTSGNECSRILPCSIGWGRLAP